jgi:hypothetical protein
MNDAQKSILGDQNNQHFGFNKSRSKIRKKSSNGGCKKKIFCIRFALFKAIDKSMNDAHYTANGGSWGVATRVYTSNHQALHSYLPGAISKTSRLPEGYPKMTSQIWPAIKVAVHQIFKLILQLPDQRCFLESNLVALHFYLPGAISKTSRLPEGRTKMTSQIWPAIAHKDGFQ